MYSTERHAALLCLCLNTRDTFQRCLQRIVLFLTLPSIIQPLRRSARLLLPSVASPKIPEASSTPPTPRPHSTLPPRTHLTHLRGPNKQNKIKNSVVMRHKDRKCTKQYKAIQSNTKQQALIINHLALRRLESVFRGGRASWRR